MITYNHEKYIEQAVRSVIMQETNFDYEVLIGEDCSKDITREIVLRLRDEFPEKIIPILQSHNVGATNNFKSVWEQARGDYIATLEGDDYWTDSKKLQIQVDFMDDNPDCSICFHGLDVVADATGEVIEVVEDNNARFSITHIFQGGKFLFHLSACMARASLLPKLPDWMQSQSTVADVMLFALFADKGAIGFVNKRMSVYRKHSTSLWFGGNPLNNIKSYSIAYTNLDRHFKYKYSGVMRVTWQYLKSARVFYESADMKNAREYAFHALRSYKRDQSVSKSKILKLIIKSYLYQIGIKFRA